VKFIGLRKDKETGDIVQYELKVYKQDVASLYKDRYGVYVCTLQGRMYKVDHDLKYMKDELDL